MDFFKKPLYKVNEGRKLSGVCMGLSESTDIDVSWIRLLFIFLLVFTGAGILLYLILAIVLDYKPKNKEDIIIEPKE